MHANKSKILSLEDLVATLREVVATIGIDPTKIPWDAINFDKDCELPLYIYKYDLMEVLAENQELNIFIV